MDRRTIEARIQSQEEKMLHRIENCLKNPKYCMCHPKRVLWWGEEEKRSSATIITGKILHLDGDKRYSEKSSRYYKSLGLEAIVKNIPENKQMNYVNALLERYQPDILVITGHERIY